MLYYGRYVRNESFVGFSGIVMLYAMLRHLEVGGKKYLLLLAGALALHFTSKETAFIYTAQALLYLAIYFIAQVTRHPWKNAEKDYRSFIIALGIAVLFGGLTIGYGLFIRDTSITRRDRDRHAKRPRRDGSASGHARSWFYFPNIDHPRPGCFRSTHLCRCILNSRIYMGKNSQRTLV